MAYELGDIVKGTIVRVKPYAFFLEFEDGSKGLLHISELSDLYIKDIEKYGEVGDEIKVKIIEIDGKNGFLRTSYKAIEGNDCNDLKKKSKLYSIEAEKNEINAINEHLNDWIKNELEKMEENKK